MKQKVRRLIASINSECIYISGRFIVFPDHPLQARISRSRLHHLHDKYLQHPPPHRISAAGHASCPNNNQTSRQAKQRRELLRWLAMRRSSLRNLGRWLSNRVWYFQVSTKGGHDELTPPLLWNPVTKIQLHLRGEFHSSVGSRRRSSTRIRAFDTEKAESSIKPVGLEGAD